MTGSTAVTCVVGKDDSLENSIARMQQALAAHGFNVVARQWGNPAPHIWWVHVVDADNPRCFTNGKGATRQAALASALGEFVERLACNYFFADFYWGEVIARGDFVHYPNEKWFAVGEGVLGRQCPAGLLDDELAHFYDPTGELPLSELHDINAGISARGICTLPFVRQSDAEVVYFPVNIINNLYVSNGMAAGNTVMEARTQALSEIVERWVKNTIIAEGIALPRIPAAVLARYPHLVEAVAQMRAQGYCVQLLDASLGGQFPVIAAVLLNPVDGGCLTAFGAHPHFAVALERSLTELLQGRSFEGLNDVPRPTFNAMAVSEPENFVEHFIDSTGVISWRFFSARQDYAFCEWDFSASNAEERQQLLDILGELGKEVYIASFDLPGASACRILVPDYSEIYPVEDLIWDNTNKALDYREDILNLHRLSDDELAALFQRLEDSQLDNYTDIRTLIGIEFDENTVWGQLTILELKLLICLAINELETAAELTEAFLQYNDNTVERNLFYQAISAVLEITLDAGLALDDYQHNLRRMFGTEVMDAVLGSVTGEVRFYGLSATSLNLEGLDKHQRLIDSYKKLHRARAKAAQYLRPQ